MEPLLEVLAGRRLGLVPQRVRTDDGCRRHEGDADQGKGGCPSHSGGFGRGSRRLYLTRRGWRLAPPPSATGERRLPQDADQHRPERPIPLAVHQHLGEGATLRIAPRTRPIRSTRPQWSSRSTEIRSLVHHLGGFPSRPPLAPFRQSAPSPSPTKQSLEFGSRSQGFCRIKSAVLLGAGHEPYRSPERQQAVRLRRRRGRTRDRQRSH